MDLETVKEVRVLVVDDDEDDYFIINKTFKRIPNSPFIVEWTPSFEEAKRRIDSDEYDIFLIDYRLGEHTGLELLEFADASKRSEPFILLTGVGDQEIEWRSIKLAASDYLVKSSVTNEILSRALYYALGRKRAEAQRIQQLVDLNRSKDEFISIASHQLRTPATTVKQYIGMLREGFVGTLDEQQQMVVEKAYENNERQLRIVSDLLKVAQVDAGHILLKKETVALGALLEDIVYGLKNTLSQRRQKIVFTAPNPDVKIEADIGSLRMVFENLLDNASKYSQEGKTVKIILEGNDTSATVHILDHGVGVKKSDSNRLFEKFSRLPNPLSTKVGGTGLGLYWAKKIVNLHNGDITYKSQEAKGTTFTVELPKNS